MRYKLTCQLRGGRVGDAASTRYSSSSSEPICSTSSCRFAHASASLLRNHTSASRMRTRQDRRAATGTHSKDFGTAWYFQPDSAHTQPNSSSIGLSFKSSCTMLRLQMRANKIREHRAHSKLKQDTDIFATSPSASRQDFSITFNFSISVFADRVPLPAAQPKYLYMVQQRKTTMQVRKLCRLAKQALTNTSPVVSAM